MRISKAIQLAGIFAVMFASQISRAEVIEFPQEELATESVLPVFDKMEVVKNRNVPTKGLFSLGLGFGLNLTEALYDNKNYNFDVAYNFTDIHGVQFMGMILPGELSDMGKDLAVGKGLLPGQVFDASMAPKPKSYMALNYQVTAYYGKISLSKEYVINFSLYGLLGATQVQFSDSSSIGLNVGIGQKFYLNSWLGVKMDFLVMSYNGPDPTTAEQPLNKPVSSSELDQKLYFQSFFNIGLVANL